MAAKETVLLHLVRAHASTSVHLTSLRYVEAQPHLLACLSNPSSRPSSPPTFYTPPNSFSPILPYKSLRLSPQNAFRRPNPTHHQYRLRLRRRLPHHDLHRPSSHHLDLQHLDLCALHHRPAQTPPPALRKSRPSQIESRDHTRGRTKAGGGGRAGVKKGKGSESESKNKDLAMMRK